MNASLEVKLADGERIEIDISNITRYLKAKDSKQTWYYIHIERFVTIDIDDKCLDELAATYFDVYTEMKSRNISKLCVYVSATVDTRGPKREFYKENIDFSYIQINRIERILLKYCVDDVWHESVDDTIFIHHVNRALSNAHADTRVLSKLNINVESITWKER